MEEGIPKVEGLEELVAPDKPEETSESKPEKTDQFQGNYDNLLKSYRGQQGYATKVAQENKELKERQALIDQENARLREQAELAQYSAYQAPVQAPIQTQEEAADFLIDPEKAVQTVENIAARKAQQMLQQRDVEAVLNEKRMENPEEFMERYSYARAIANNYPQLTQSAAGIRKLFEIADTTRDKALQKQAGKAMKHLFGENVDLEAMKNTFVKQTETNNNNAFMPDTTIITGHETESDTGIDSKIAKAVADGDYNEVTRLEMEKAMQG